jgi:hypothetical protein
MKITPTDYIEYIISCLSDTPTEDLQMLYTWLGKSKPAFKLRGVIRRTIENRTNRSSGAVLNFNESQYLDSMAQSGVRDNTNWCRN